MRLLCLFGVLLAGLTGPLAMAAAPALVVSAGGATRQFTSDALLTRHDAATLAVPHDPAYGGVVSYRAVPLRALLSELPPDAGDTIQARATDGFVAELPRALIGGWRRHGSRSRTLRILGPISEARPSRPVHSTWSGRMPSVLESRPSSGPMH